jgi:hypothetical protein
MPEGQQADPVERLPPEWEPPFPLGSASAVLDTAAAVGTPIMAGFTVTLIGLVVTTPLSVRYPGLALALLTAAALALIAAIEFAFFARQWDVTPAQIAEWLPGTPLHRQMMWQRMHRKGFTTWAARFSRFQRFGVLLLLAGISFVLVPAGPIGAGRALAIGIAGVGFVAEVIWIAATTLLAGFPAAAYDDTPDIPFHSPGRWWLQGPLGAILIRLARMLIPVTRIHIDDR